VPAVELKVMEDGRKVRAIRGITEIEIKAESLFAQAAPLAPNLV